MNAQQLSALSIDASWLDLLNAAMDKYGIDTPQRQACFIAQLQVESQNFHRLSENLNYSAAGLLATFPKHFDEGSATDYAHEPQKIANRVYANRYGNGDEASGDGWNYRGRGLIDNTFKDNYIALGHALNMPLETDPDMLLQPSNAAMAAGQFWHDHNCNEAADNMDIAGLRKEINGGENGLAQATDFTAKAMQVMA